MAEVVERGDIFFLYVPEGGRRVRSAADVKRLYMVLVPDGGRIHRLLTFSGKRLPRPTSEGDWRERVWAVVLATSPRPEDLDRAMHVGISPRPVGEGRYCIARHDRHSHLAYVLELPGVTGPPQDQLNIQPEATYYASVRHPGLPSATGLAAPPAFPSEVVRRFQWTDFLSLDDPHLLDYPGCEVLLTGEAPDIEADELERLSPETEVEETAEIVQELKADLQRHPLEPLLYGRWR